MEHIFLEGCNRHYRRVGITQFCRGQALLGRKYVEIWGTVPHIFIDHHGFNDAENSKQILSEYNLICRTFTPKTYRYNLGDLDCFVRDWSMAYYKECIRAASVLGADKMLIYLPEVIRDGDMEAAKEVFVENISELALCADHYDILLALGGRNAFAEDLPGFINILEKINNPSVKSFLETENLLYSNYPMREWLELLKTTMIHIHFADADDFGSCKPGAGSLPIKQYLADIMKSGYYGGLSPFFTQFSCEQNPFIVSFQHDRIMKEYLRKENPDA